MTLYLVIEDAARLLDFTAAAFDAVELERVTLPDGTVMHGQVRIGDSIAMMGSAKSDWPAMPGLLHLYVSDADALYAKALAVGATSVQEPMDEFYGDRTSGVKDPCGNLWWIATHQEDVSPKEIERRAASIREGRD